MAKLLETASTVLLLACLFMSSTEAQSERGGGRGGGGGKKKVDPNIIYIMADDLGFNDVGFHNPRVRTPNIDALQREGIELTNYYAQPICTPTRSALITGRYPSNNGLQQLVVQVGAPSCLPLEHRILPEVMRNRGYGTYYVGKWHLGDCNAECLPTNRGVDQFRGVMAGTSDYFSWDHQGVVTRFVNDQPSLAGIGTHLTIQEGRDVQELINAHNLNKPLFMIISPTAPHTPLNVTDEMFNVHNFLDANDPDQAGRRRYLGLVSALDDLVGVTVNAIRARGMQDNTIIVFTSDNGGTTTNVPVPGFEDFANNYPLRNGKFSYHEGGIRVPTIYYDPRLRASNRGTKRDFLMHITDWMPTFAELGGQRVNRNRGLDGYSQVSNLKNKYNSKNKYKVRKEILIGLSDFVTSRFESTTCSNMEGSYRLRDYKLIYGRQTSVVPTAADATEWVLPVESPETPPIFGDSCMRMDAEGNMVARCLFNIADDPSEQINLFDQEPRIVQSLLRRLERADRDGVQNVYTAAQSPSPLNSRPLGDVLVINVGYCTPQIDFPLIPQPSQCLLEIN